MAKVGIVLVSHSARVAEGIKEILEEVVTDVPIQTAGGTDTGEIGTSFPKIMEAIEKAYTEKGVLVFYDLGSAMMNAEMAVEQLSLDKVIVAEDIPLVEGAYVAAVEASMGHDLKEVFKRVKETFSNNH